MFNLRQLAALVVTTAMGASAFAAGYEKNILWSGKNAGMANAVVGSVTGSEALYFNPAGLVGAEGSREATLNVSPTISQFKAPVVQDNQVLESKQEFYVIPALFYSSSPTEKFGYGIGAYTAGGSRVQFNDLDLTSVNANITSRPTLKTEITATEISAGAAYKITKDLKFGAAYRFGMVEAAFSSMVQAAGPSVIVVNLENLKGTQHGFRTGLQYTPEAKPFGLGLMYRSALHFKVDGDVSATIDTAAPGGASAIPTSGTADVKTIFPAQIVAGGYWDVVPEAWRARAEYVWTQYSRNQFLAINGTINPGAVTAIPAIQQQWRDQSSVKLAGEYLRTKYPIRFGYQWNSGVENPSFARANFAAPGKAHTYTLGTGRSNEKWDINVSADYTQANIDNAVPVTSALGARGGEYTTTAYAIHTGVTYKF